MSDRGWLTGTHVPLVALSGTLLAMPAPYLPAYQVPHADRVRVAKALERAGYKSHALLLVGCAALLAIAARRIVPPDLGIWNTALFCLAMSTAGLLCVILCGRAVARLRQLIWLHQRFPAADRVPGLIAYWSAQTRLCSAAQARTYGRSCTAVAVAFPLLAISQIGAPASQIAPFFMVAGIAVLFAWKWWLLAQAGGRPR